MDDLLSEFLTETAESLDVVDVELVQFERDPNDAKILDNIFRLVHTIKGTCGFLGLPRLEALAHASETLMGKFRDGAEVVPGAVSVILLSIDRIKLILSELEEQGAEPEGVDSDLIEQLETLSLGAEAAAAEPPDQAPAEELAQEPEADELPPLDSERGTRIGEVSLDDLERAFQSAPGPEDDAPELEANVDISTEAPPEVVAEEAAPAPAELSPMAAAEDQPADEPAAAATGGERKEGPVKNQSIRVNVDTLETLMTMVSELVLTRNQLLEMVRRLDDSEFKVPLQRLSNVTAELQEGVMKTRMQPIGNAWQKLPRIVRDLSNELDKKIELDMRGAETELDRQVLELIKDPLTHMVRNSADHGIEMPADRLAKGKTESGRILLRAFHEGGHIIIEISDDGRGLPVDKIKEKVVSRGLATEAELEKMTPAQVYKFIFAPGFSTAAEVTSVSGRGVGMDVVRTNIELIGGSIDVKSKEGRGSTFTIKIPLTLAIVSALIVQCAGQRFAIPQLNVVELVRANNESDHRIELINNTPVLRLRNRLLPLVDLAGVFGIQDDERVGAGERIAIGETADIGEGIEPGDGIETSDGIEPGENIETAKSVTAGEGADESDLQSAKSEGFIIVTQVGNQNFGIVVDSVFDTEEIVVKPMSSLLRDITVFSGNTILGDGSVILIVDPNGVAQQVSHEVASQSDAENAQQGQDITTSDSLMSLLIFRAGSEEPKAVPLSLVTRLEQINVADIEQSNGRDLVQYRGQLMPLVRMHGLTENESGTQPVLVFSDGDRSLGISVDAIDDIVEATLDIEMADNRPGSIGSAVVKGKATEIIDVGHFISEVFDDWGDAKSVRRGDDKPQLLLIDDSPFFRDMLAPVLSSAGYVVTAVESAKDALALKEAGRTFDAIISDIEMPDIDGFALAAELKSDASWGEIPLIALSCDASKSDLERGRAAGFFDFVGKFDREGLVRTVQGSLVDMEVAA